MAARPASVALPRIATRIVNSCAVIFIGAAVAFALVGLQERAVASDERAHRAAQVRDAVRVVDGLEWRAVSSKFWDGRVTMSDINAHGAKLRALVDGYPAAPAVLSENVNRYLTAVGDMFVYLDADDRRQAADVDAERVDPAYEELIELVETISTNEQERATATHDAARNLMAVGIVTASILIAGLVFTLSIAGERRRRASNDRRFRSLIETSEDVITVATGIDTLTLMSPSFGKFPTPSLARSGRVHRSACSSVTSTSSRW